MKKMPAWLLLFFATPAAAQYGNVTIGTPTVDSLLSKFASNQRDVLPIYNGRLFNAYAATIEGIPFYASKDWQQGSILYDGTWYYNMSLLYDCVQDAVVVRHPNGVVVILNSDRVQEFSFGENYFVHLYQDKDRIPKSGFYQRLVNGELQLYARRSKLIEERIVGNELFKKFVESFSYYAYQDGKFIHLKKAKELMSLTKQNKPKVTQYINSQDVSMKKETERAMILIAKYNNQLQ